MHPHNHPPHANTSTVKRQKKDIAALLRDNKEEKARIRTEAIIREDFKLEALDILSLLCELLHERMGLIISMKQCPPDMVESVSTLIWAAPRVEVPELQKVAKLFKAKYGKEFFMRASRNTDGVVNEKIVNKLGVQPPNAFLVLSYMKAIAKANGVEWVPSEVTGSKLNEPLPAPRGLDSRSGQNSGMADAFGQLATADIALTGERVKCGSCSAILAVPVGVVRFACSNCGAVLEAPRGNDNDGGSGGSSQGGGGGASGGNSGGVDIPMPPSNVPGTSGNDSGKNGYGGSGGGGGGGGGGIPDIPMPPSSLPGGFDIPMPPSNMKSDDGSAQFMTEKPSSSENGNDKYAAEAAALAAGLQAADSSESRPNIPVVPAKPVSELDADFGDKGGMGGQGGGGGSAAMPNIPMPPMATPVIPDEGKSGGDDDSRGGGNGVPSFDALQARFAALQGR